MQNIDPCNVCGSTDANLIDGFYYCVECGTQDVNIRHTEIEEGLLTDGAKSFGAKRKLRKTAKEKVEMASEWHKWHTYNFLLAGLADRLVKIGASQSFKKKLLWLWTEYMKKFQDKHELGLPQQQENDNTTQDVDEFRIDKNTKQQSHFEKTQQKKVDSYTKIIKKTTIVGMLYLALNLDDSHIQLSDVYRFFREDHIDMMNFRQFVPQDIIYESLAFNLSFPTMECIREASYSIIICLNIPPRVPNMRKLIDKYVKELCLPKEFKKLVFALMYEYPCDHLELDMTRMKEDTKNIPYYECTAMSYIVVALKMCFGLDDDYEDRLSDAVDEINDSNCYPKSYKLGNFSESSDRLFSFREWCNYIQLRKIILCKYNMHFAEECNLDNDDFISIEQSNRQERKKAVSDEIVMDLIDKLQLVNVPYVLSRKDFKPTTTPLTSYTNIILEHVHDSNLMMLLSEDFSKYSLKYACRDVCLINKDNKNIIVGVDGANKYISAKIIFGDKCEIEKHIVFVRNCNNKNWLKTQQPRTEHIKKEETDVNSETASNEINIDNDVSSDINIKDQIGYKFESNVFKEETCNIFDDDFEDLKEDEVEEAVEDNSNVCQNDDIDIDDPVHSNIDNNDGDIYSSNESDIYFNYETFHRDKTIREIILSKCKQYAIKIPSEYKETQPRKRKSNHEVGVSKSKSPKFTDGQNKARNKTTKAKDEVDKLLAAYYENVQHDVFFQISNAVKSAVRNVDTTQNNLNMVNETPKSTIDSEEKPSESDKENESNFKNTDAHPIENNNTYDNVLVFDEETVHSRDDEEECNENDPRFDEKKYDINQLYVKVEPENEYDYMNDVANDCELVDIVNKITEKYENHKLNMRPNQPQETHDSDDDIPLSVMRQEKLEILEQKKIKAAIKFKSLVNNNGLNEFKYWTRHYHENVRQSHTPLGESFQKELRDKFPTSFSFVLNECAQIIYCNPNILYKAVCILEEYLV